MGHLKHFVIITVLFAITLFGFQNCAQPLSEEDEISSIAANAPFAFDIQMDTVAHMSCGNMSGYDRDAYFSFAAGALNPGSGLKYSAAYMNHTGGIGAARRQLLLDESPLNSGAELQIGVRRITDYNIFSPGGSNVEGFAYANYAAGLTTPEVALSLPEGLGSARTNNFGALGSLVIKNDLVQSNFSSLSRSEMIGSQALLAIGYGNNSNPNGPVRPTANRAYGRGIAMNFQRAPHISSGEATQVSQAIEYNTENGNPIGAWSCPSTSRYLIVRNSDAGVNFTCGANLIPGVEENPSVGQEAELAELRKFLPVSKWGIDLNRKCIVPKNGVAGNCYGGSNSVRYTGVNQTCSGALGNCPHYVSICKR